MDFFLGCPEKVQVSFLIPIPITRYLLFTQHCVGSEKSNPERIHKWTSFNRIRRWKFRLEYSKLMFFNFFFRESFLKSRRVTWMIQSILPFFLLMLEEEKKRRKRKHRHANYLKGNFIERLKLLFVWDLCLYRLSHGAHLQIFRRKLTIEYHLYYWKIERRSFIQEV